MSELAAGDAGMTLGDVVADNARRFPDVVAYREDEREVTHSGLAERGARLVSAMVAAGVRHQDRIALMSRNGLEFAELLAASQMAGIVMATINFRLSSAEVLDALQRVTPTIVFCEDEFAPVIAGLSNELTGVLRTVSIGAQSWPHMTGYEEFVGEGQSEALPFVAQPEDIACLLFTSGTTGASKCCILGHRELRRVGFALNAAIGVGSADTGLIPMPMFHFGAISIIGSVHAGGGTVLLQKQFDPAEAVGLCARHGVTLLHLAPVMLQALLDQPAVSSGLSTVRSVLYGAAPMTPHTLRKAMRSLPNAGFINLYGQTEASATFLPRELHALDDADAERRLGSVGFPFPGTRIRLVDDEGREVPVGEPGEILIRSDSMFRGYWNDQAATLVTLRNGWCHTGDVGRFDDRGLLYLVDRKKDVIISGGENVYSPEVEDAVSGMESVAACSVIGTPDRKWGEAVCAVVVTRPGATTTLEDIQFFVRQRLARYKVPRRLVIVDELPVLDSGKVDKKRLRATIAAPA